MRMRSLMACGLLVLALGCGDDEGENNDGTNNATNNDDGTNNGGTNNDIPPQDDWEATVTGGPTELTGMGPKLTIVRDGSTWSFGSNAADGGQLAFNINGGDALMESPYRVLLFELEFPEEEIDCLALADLRITVENVDPPEGTVAGGVSCESKDGTEMFEGTVEGSWEALPPE